MKQMVGVIAGVLALVGCGYSPDTGSLGAAHEQIPLDAGKDDKDGGPPPPPPGLCRMTGGGQIEGEGENPDSFGGNAAYRRGDFIGEWNHVTHDGEHFHAHTITLVECFVDDNNEEPPEAGFSRIEFEGIGTFEGETCSFSAVAEDHGEGGNAPAEDQYWISIDCPGTENDYSTEVGAEILRGNIQIHPLPPGFLP